MPFFERIPTEDDHAAFELFKDELNSNTRTDLHQIKGKFNYIGF